MSRTDARALAVIMAVREASRAITCLYVELDESIVNDLRAKVEAAFKAYDHALDQAKRETIDDVLVYANMRGMIADQSKHVEKLAGNIVKEAREDGAIAELFGLEQWCRQQAHDRPGGGE